MDLIEFRPDLLFIGMSLPFTLREESGQILLVKGQKIETSLQLTGLQSRSKIFVEIDATGEGVRALMSGISELNRVDAPIKDFFKYLNVKDPGKAVEKDTGTLSQRWGDVESKLGGLLASAQATGEFQDKLYLLQEKIGSLLNQDATGSQFLLCPILVVTACCIRCSVQLWFMNWRALFKCRAGSGEAWCVLR
jgi:hypothetical protein